MHLLITHFREGRKKAAESQQWSELSKKLENHPCFHSHHWRLNSRQLLKKNPHVKLFHLLRKQQFTFERPSSREWKRCALGNGIYHHSVQIGTNIRGKGIKYERNVIVLSYNSSIWNQNVGKNSSKEKIRATGDSAAEHSQRRCTWVTKNVREYGARIYITRSKGNCPRSWKRCCPSSVQEIGTASKQRSSKTSSWAAN